MHSNSPNELDNRVAIDTVPADLKDLKQWVCWKAEQRSDGTHAKAPYQASGHVARVNDSSTWNTFDEVVAALKTNRFAGIGFVFDASNGFVGIDLDGCRDPESGQIASWATTIIDSLSGTYAEVSPSGSGVKLIGKGKSPFDRGVNVKLPEYGERGGKQAGIEVYDAGRFFAITGNILSDADREPCDLPNDGLKELRRLVDDARLRRDPTSTLAATATSVSSVQGTLSPFDRCQAFVATLPGAISGQSGHSQTFLAACECARFGLSRDDSQAVMTRYNERCEPPWTPLELDHKIDSAANIVRERGEFGSRIEVVSAGNRSPARDAWRHTDPTTQKLVNGEPPAPPEFTRLMSSAELVKHDFRADYIVNGILVAGQPCIVGGFSKSLKTSITIDLAISIATGTNFLGRFPCQKKRVGMWSGESGGAAIKSTAQRVAAARNVDLETEGPGWSFDLPKLSRTDDLGALETMIAENGLDVVIIDPLYLTLLSGEEAGMASNLYAMGAKLAPVGEIGKRTGCTMILVHHFRATAARQESDEVASLSMLSLSGVQEWARQWLLLQRRSPYQSDGKHSLWFRAGGSAGHASFWAIDIDEGVYDASASNGNGRHWTVSVDDAGPVIERSRSERQLQRDRQRQDAAALRDKNDERAVAKFLGRLPQGETKKAIRASTGFSNPRASAALERMIGTGHIRETIVTKNGRNENGYRYVENPGHISAILTVPSGNTRPPTAFTSDAGRFDGTIDNPPDVTSVGAGGTRPTEYHQDPAGVGGEIPSAPPSVPAGRVRSLYIENVPTPPPGSLVSEKIRPIPPPPADVAAGGMPPCSSDELPDWSRLPAW